MRLIVSGHIQNMVSGSRQKCGIRVGTELGTIGYRFWLHPHTSDGLKPLELITKKKELHVN